MAFRVGLATRALHDAAECGDACGFWPGAAGAVLCLVDGLGHGPEAAKAADLAIACVGSHQSLPLPELFRKCDAALADSRGAALGVAVVDSVRQRIVYGGVGNTRGLLIGAGRHHRFSSAYGIVGAGFRSLRTEEVAFLPGDILVLSSDGIEETLSVTAYPEDLLRNPEALAPRLLADWAKGGDDAAVLVFRT